jgi:hypothetical protein
MGGFCLFPVLEQRKNADREQNYYLNKTSNVLFK